MYFNLFIIFVIFFWIMAFYIASIIFIIFIDRYFKKQNSNIDNALNNIITSLGVLSAIIFFSFNSIITIAKEKVAYYINIVINIYMGITLSLIFVYLLHNIIKAIKRIIPKIGNIILKKNIVDFQYSSSIEDKLFSIFEWFLIVVLSFLFSFFFLKLGIFNLSFSIKK